MRISTIKQRDGCGTVRRRRSKACSPCSKSTAAPTITPNFSEDSESDKLVVSCNAGIAQTKTVNGSVVNMINYDCSRSGDKTKSTTFDLDEFDRGMPLYIGVLGCNGKITRMTNVWKATHRSPIRIDNSDIVLNKQSVLASDPDKGHQWTVMLNEKGPDGKLSRAKKIDLRVGAVLDGAVVYYEDGHKTPCGYRYYGNGSPFNMGGGNSQMLHLPPGVDIAKVEVKTYGWSMDVLGGITMTLSDGTKAGALNTYPSPTRNLTKVLEAGPGQKIVGFYGTSWDYTQEFGIVTGPNDVELPPQTYDMPQLQNIQAKGRTSD
ncbi:hypothetical protein M436DRAFT_85473 [Aureobasidium namibiae CBS 147.97]|uniref:Jacalin-type lectin domain-containing protein n=1 Tax=Aureobasidium namibiae CBS 147.97 TaxID=1043004 RepID=A0A074W968_9PEZI